MQYNLIEKDGTHRYGTCYQCGSPIAIPGSQIFTCSKCGWVETIEYKQYKLRMDKEDEIRRRNDRTEKFLSRKREANERLRSITEEDSEPSLFLEAID